MIKLRQICFSYADEVEGGLENIDLSIKDGECILLCGRSGCGKTTITRLVNGLIPNFFCGDLSGKVTINEMDVLNTPMYEVASHVGSVFQNPRTQFFNVDTDSEIAFGIENEALPPAELHKRLDETSQDLKINHLRGRNIFELSGGEKQKIAFASIYAMNPDVYLLDEPSSNLDMAAINDLKEHLRLIKQQGKTILIAEHRLYYLMDLVDKIIYLSNGKIEGVYTPSSFCKISESMRKIMGLRARDLNEVYPFPAGDKGLSAVLEIKDVGLYYKKRIVMEHINLRAAKGEVIGIVGHNGAGKTTFLRTLCGLHKDYSGEFLWEGAVQNSKEKMKRSYLVMQDVNYELFAESVEAECSLGIRNTNPAQIDQVITELDLSAFRKRHPNTLSGGQKQRVAIAVSMVCGKELLVFDEPTSGLDFDSMKQVGELIQKLSEDKVVFVVTHDYEFACQVCSRLIHFENGIMTDDLLMSKDNESRICNIFGLEQNYEREK